MLWEDGVGVYQNLIVPLHLQGVLLLGTVVVAQEAGALLYVLCGYACTSGDYACRIPLYCQYVLGQTSLAFRLLFRIVDGEFACLHLAQVFVTLACKLPVLQFALEELLHLLGVHLVLPQGVQQAACLYLLGAQLVLVLVVAVYLLLTESRVAVALPTAAQVHLVVYAAYAVPAAYHQSQGIVLAITGVRYLQFAQYGGVEGSRRSQSVYPQCIVPAVLRSPFPVVNESGGQGLQLEVAHPVTAYHHGGILLKEHVHHPLQSVLAAIQVVAVQLHHEASHSLVVYGHVPASAYAKVVTLRHNVYHTRVVGVAFYYLRGAVRRTVVHHNQVVGK